MREKERMVAMENCLHQNDRLATPLPRREIPPVSEPGRKVARQKAENKTTNAGGQNRARHFRGTQPQLPKLASGRLQALRRGLRRRLLRVQQALFADVMNAGLPVIQPADIRDKPFALAELGIMSHKLAADRDAGCNQIEFRHLLQRLVSAIQKRKINLETAWLLGQPWGNHPLRKAEKRREPVQRFGRAGAKVREHPIV